MNFNNEDMLHIQVQILHEVAYHPLDNVVRPYDVDHTFQVQLHIQIQADLFPFQVLWILYHCMQYNLGKELLNFLVFLFQSRLDIESMAQLHNKDHHKAYNLLIFLDLAHHILGKAYM